MLKLDWGDAQVWMDTAVLLYSRSTPTSDDFVRAIPAYPWGNELNVAAVCAGYAFELLFKVLVRARGGQPEPQHEPSVAFRMLAKLARGDCEQIARIVTQHGWTDTEELLRYLDTHLCDKNRKYWMKPPKGGRARGIFNFVGRKRLDALKRLHEDLSQFALKRINERQDVFEDWPGIPSVH